MNIVDKQLIKRKIETINLIQKAYEILLKDGDISTFCKENQLNEKALYDLLNIDWSFTKFNSPSDDYYRLKLNSTIEVINLSTRPYNALKTAGFNNVADLLELSYEDLKSIKNLGVNGINELIEQMNNYGFSGWFNDKL